MCDTADLCACMYVFIGTGVQAAYSPATRQDECQVGAGHAPFSGIQGVCSVVKDLSGRCLGEPDGLHASQCYATGA